MYFVSSSLFSWKREFWKSNKKYFVSNRRQISIYSREFWEKVFLERLCLRKNEKYFHKNFSMMYVVFLKLPVIISCVCPCGRYFATWSSKRRHKSEMQISSVPAAGSNPNPKRTQPKRIAVMRQMSFSVLNLGENLDDKLEWFEEIDVDSQT